MENKPIFSHKAINFLANLFYLALESFICDQIQVIFNAKGNDKDIQVFTNLAPHSANF